MITKIHDKLESANPFAAGDSSLNQKFREFLAKLDALREGNVPFTLVLDDPLSNCYVYSPLSPSPDPQIVIEEYERTFEQNDDLGLNDIKV